MMRLAKFLVSHTEHEWLFHAQDVPEKCVVYGDSDWAGSETRRSTTGSNGLDSIPSNSAARLSMSSLSQVERQSCMQQDVRQQEGCSEFSGWSRPEWIRVSAAPGRELALDSGRCT